MRRNEQKDFTGKRKLYTMEMGLAMLPTMQKDEDDIKRIYHAELTDPGTMKQMGIDVGVRLMTECPDFMKLV